MKQTKVLFVQLLLEEQTTAQKRNRGENVQYVS